MADKVQTASGGIGLGGAFFLVLFILKVCGPLAALSWWWVTAPLWIPAALCLTIALGALTLWIVLAIIGAVSARKAHNRRCANRDLK